MAVVRDLFDLTVGEQELEADPAPAERAVPPLAEVHPLRRRA